MDEQLFLLINGHHTAFVDQFMFLVSQKSVWIPLYFTLLYVIWRNYSWKGALTALVMIGLGMLVTDYLNAHYLRVAIGRLRPCHPDNPLSQMVHIVNGKRSMGYGCPSAHSANIWMLVMVMRYWLADRRVNNAMIVLGLVVCYSRIYLGLHYPLDILGGFVLAWIVKEVIIGIYKSYFKASQVYAVKGKMYVPAVLFATFVAFAGVAAYRVYAV